jgi:dihydrodipicolinate synthase/N-acetylneuraminate lyase
MTMTTQSRRHFLTLAGSALILRAAPGRTKSLQGIFPIAQSPFTGANRLDLEALSAEVRFLDRTGVHGVVWPQMASEYSTLSETERFAGAEAITSTGKPLRPAIVIGVQAPETATAVRYAQHAVKNGADAIIALPPAGVKDPTVIASYYGEIGKAADLPLFVQAIGDMSVDFLVRMAQDIPTLRYVKDEAGESPLPRMAPLRDKSEGKLHVFTGNHGVTLIDEMRRGAAGCMPASAFADLYADVWNLWEAGKHAEAIDRFGKTLVFITEAQTYGLPAVKYLLHLRGVFPTFETRVKEAHAPLDESAKGLLKELLDTAKPYLRA